MTAVYRKTDGIVAWEVCTTGKPDVDIEVTDTHLGLVFNPNVYLIVANRLAGEGSLVIGLAGATFQRMPCSVPVFSGWCNFRFESNMGPWKCCCSACNDVPTSSAARVTFLVATRGSLGQTLPVLRADESRLYYAIVRGVVTEADERGDNRRVGTRYVLHEGGANVAAGR